MGGVIRKCRYCSHVTFGSGIHRCDKGDKANGRPTALEEYNQRKLKREQRKADKEAQEMYSKIKKLKQ